VSETRKLAAILVSDVVGYSRLAGADEDRILARLRTLRSDLIDPTIAVHHGRIVKRTGDGTIVEFRSVVDAVRCAIDIQTGLIERNAGLPPDKRIEFRVGIHLGDVVEESDGDLMGDGVNIAARLEGICEPGAICLSSAAYEQVRDRINEEFVDLGEMELKNIARPVRVYSLRAGVPAEAKPSPPKKRTALVLLGIAVLSLAIAAGGGYWFSPNRPAAVATGPLAPVASNAPAAAEAKHLSIVVLPFTNLSGDPAQDYFADGITENLTTDLSRIRNSFVIARNTAFTFKGKSIDAREIGKELGVRYVLEGSVQRDQNRVRVNAQLIDAETGAHLWAERFEEDVADLFKLQDEVVARLANTLGIELVRAEAQRGARSGNPDAIDLTMRGWALVRTLPQTLEKAVAARALFEQALKIDPNEAEALAGIAYAQLNERGYAANPEADYDEKILSPADRAIALAPDTLWAYYVKCVYLYYSHRANKAIDAADAGLAINSNFAPLWAVRGVAELFLGRFDQARSDLLQSQRLSPRDPLLGVGTKYLGDAELGLGHFDAAIDSYHRAIDLGMQNIWPYASLVAANALAGRMDDAKAALAEVRRLEPKLTMKSLIPLAPPIPNLFDGLRKAGMPEE
jgi:adenylate cyclase